MTSRTSLLLRAVSAFCVGAVTLVPAATPPATASGADTVSTTALALARSREREGHCRTGTGDWEMKVVTRRGHRLRIDFSVDDVARRQAWQVFVSANGHRVAAVTRRSRLDGDFKVRKLTHNRRGVDRIWATAVNTRRGVTCTGHMRY